VLLRLLLVLGGGSSKARLREQWPPAEGSMICCYVIGSDYRFTGAKGRG
jgi:hypothetical protein